MRRPVVEDQVLAGQRLRAHVQPYLPSPNASRAAPLGLADRHVPVGDGASRPPPAAASVARRRRRGGRSRRAVFPALGRPLDEAGRAGRPRDVVVEPPALPVPGAQVDPRQVALATVLDELDRLGIPDERHAPRCGRARRRARKAGARAAPAPAPGATFRGGSSSMTPPRPTSRPSRTRFGSTRASSAPTSSSWSRRPRPSSTAAPVRSRRLRRATVRRAARRARSSRHSGEPAWELALAVERAVAARVGLLGVSLVLDHPRLTGRFRGYPHEPGRSSTWRALRSAGSTRCYRPPCGADPARPEPGARRNGRVRRWPRSRTPRRSSDRRAPRHRLDEPLDALVVGVPWIGPHVPREPLNPITSASGRGSASPCGSGVTPFPCARMERSCSSTRSRARSRTARRRRTARSSTYPAGGDNAPTPSGRRRRTTRACARIAPAAPATLCSRMPTGRLSAGSLAARAGHRRGEPRRRRCPRARVRARATRSRARSRWRTARGRTRARRRPARPALRASPCRPGRGKPRPYGPETVPGRPLGRPNLRRGTSCGPARSS